MAFPCLSHALRVVSASVTSSERAGLPGSFLDLPFSVPPFAAGVSLRFEA